MSALEARDWLTAIDGIGKKTASVLLLFCFGLPLMPVDRHVERVVAAGRPHPGRRRSADDAHDLFLGMLEPDQMYEAHVNLIQHGRERLPRPAARPRALPAPRALPVRRPEGALEPRSADESGCDIPCRAVRIHADRPVSAPVGPTCNLPRKVRCGTRCHDVKSSLQGDLRSTFDGRPITPPDLTADCGSAARADRGRSGRGQSLVEFAWSSRFFLSSCSASSSSPSRSTRSCRSTSRSARRP